MKSFPHAEHVYVFMRQLYHRCTSRDVLWFVAKLARCMDIPLSEVMAANVAKLAARYPDGWSAELSMRRVP